jgi:hypothetical protein
LKKTYSAPEAAQKILETLSKSLKRKRKLARDLIEDLEDPGTDADVSPDRIPVSDKKVLYKADDELRQRYADKHRAKQEKKGRKDVPSPADLVGTGEIKTRQKYSEIAPKANLPKSENISKSEEISHVGKYKGHSIHVLTNKEYPGAHFFQIHGEGEGGNAHGGRTDGADYSSPKHAIDSAKNHIDKKSVHKLDSMSMEKSDHLPEELDKCGEMKKSGYGPKGGGQYTPADNVRRKAANVGDIETGLAGVKVKTGANRTGGQGKRSLEDTVRKIHAKNRKQPVRSVELSDEEKKRLTDRIERKKSSSLKDFMGRIDRKKSS